MRNARKARKEQREAEVARRVAPEPRLARSFAGRSRSVDRED
jgi:hypothetical protein